MCIFGLIHGTSIEDQLRSLGGFVEAPWTWTWHGWISLGMGSSLLSVRRTQCSVFPKGGLGTYWWDVKYLQVLDG